MPIPYLTEAELFPAILTVAAAARGQVPAVDGAHAGYGVTDFVTLKFWPSGSPMPVPAVAKSMADCGKDLDSFAHANQGIAQHTIDWSKWLTLLQTIATVLKGLGVGA